MDFVVTGILIGAILVVAGTGLRDFGPRSRPRIVRNDSNPLEPEVLVRAWRRFCQSAGTLVTTLGLAIVLATVVAMVFDLSDSAGSIIVATSVAISAAVLVFAVLTMPNHYRRGGFDPVTRVMAVNRPPAAVIDHDVVLPLASIGTSSGDDLFANLALPERPGSGTATASVDDTQLPGTQAPADHLPRATAAEMTIEAEDAVPEPIETDSARVEPEVSSDAGSSPWPPISESPPGQAPRRRLATPSGRRLTERLRDQELLAQPTLANEFAPGPPIEEPAIEPDEELPAWNAPPKAETPREVQRRPQAGTESPTPPPARPAAGFASSLFADLDVSGSEDEQNGSFRSRLLSDLTGDEDGDGTPRADILLDEFSLPEQQDPVKPDAENSR